MLAAAVPSWPAASSQLPPAAAVCMSHQLPEVCSGLTSLLMCPAAAPAPAAVSQDSYGLATPALAATRLYMLCICSCAALAPLLLAAAAPAVSPAAVATLEKKGDGWEEGEVAGPDSWAAVPLEEVVKG